MSKELIALEILYNDAKLDRDRIEKGGIVTYAEEIEHNERIKPYYDTIKQALQELDDIKNSNPSDAMRKLDIIENELCDSYFFYQKYSKEFDTIKNYILKAQEQENALSIIIKKNVSVWGFRNRVFGYQKKQNGNRTINDTYENYLNMFGCYHNGFDIEILTEEEFNTLKEYFDNENNK